MKTVKVRWRLGAKPPDPLSLQRLGVHPRPPTVPLLPNSGCATAPYIKKNKFYLLRLKLTVFKVGILGSKRKNLPPLVKKKLPLAQFLVTGLMAKIISKYDVNLAQGWATPGTRTELDTPAGISGTRARPRKQVNGM